MKEQFPNNTYEKENGSLTDYDNGDSDADDTLMTSSNITNSDLQLSSMSSSASNNSQNISSLYYLNFYKKPKKSYRILSATETQETMNKVKSLMKNGPKKRSKSKPTTSGGRNSFFGKNDNNTKKEVRLGRSITYHNSFNSSTSIVVDIKKGLKRFDISSINSPSLLTNLLNYQYSTNMGTKDYINKYWGTPTTTVRRPSLMVDDDAFSNPSTGNRDSTISSTSEDIENGHRNSVLTTTSGYYSDRSQIPSTSREPSFVIDSSIKHYLNSRPLLRIENSISHKKIQDLFKQQSVPKKFCIIIELLETERSYLNDLEDIL
uniref:DH domain-containing protein n=1 Tax=Parastrongyloides trichosuri TaxID=131310 RepID=A0A0N4ZJR1_PARTI